MFHGENKEVWDLSLPLENSHIVKNMERTAFSDHENMDKNCSAAQT